MNYNTLQSQLSLLQQLKQKKMQIQAQKGQENGRIKVGRLVEELILCFKLSSLQFPGTDPERTNLRVQSNLHLARGNQHLFF